MKKILGVSAACFAATVAIVLLLRRFFKRGKSEKTSSKKHHVIDGMRDIKKPFEEEVLRPESTPQTVVVKNKDFKKGKVYKRDILTIIGMAVVIVMVIVLSIFAFYSRQQQDETMRTKSMEIEVAVMQTLEKIENNSMTLSETADSVDLHIKQGINSLKEAVITLQKTQEKGNKK